MKYDWLRDPKWPNVVDPKIISFLESENKYADQYISDSLFEELKSRVTLNDKSVPVKEENYLYYYRTSEDEEYKKIYRKHIFKDEEELILDENLLADSFFNLGVFTVSGDFFAYSFDDTGGERYKIKVYDMQRKKHLEDLIQDVTPTICMKNDGFFYIKYEKDNWRAKNVFYHKIGSSDDQLIYREEDDELSVRVSLTKDKKYLIINSRGYVGNAIRVLDVKTQKMEFFLKKEDGCFYTLEHRDGIFYILTNKNAENYKIVKYSNGVEEDFIEIPGKFISSFDITKDFVLLNLRCNANDEVAIHDGNSLIEIKFDEEAYEASIYTTDFYNNDIRIYYSSLVSPDTTYFWSNGNLEILKRKQVPGYNPEEYVVKRFFVDGVPLTVLSKKGAASTDCLMLGYGAYGITSKTNFRSSVFSLVNKGFCYAIAGVRGGKEFGDKWYQDGKLEKKTNTFKDFISCAKFLKQQNINLHIMGGSAGGMLIGAVLNMEPKLFKSAILLVPFVDVLSTMLDETLPLTPLEFNEWGNPKDPKYFEIISKYSPFDNIQNVDYPHMMVTGGISDPRVGYWEPAKYVAKLRDMKTDKNVLILKTNMNAGHAGASGRFSALKELAEEYDFILKARNDFSF